jgi:hypothetical protein
MGHAGARAQRLRRDYGYSASNSSGHLSQKEVGISFILFCESISKPFTYVLYIESYPQPLTNLY